MEFNAAFKSLTGFPPFHWQARLYDQYFSKGELPAGLDLPTGLGKTSVMAVWLIARALGNDEARRKLPRRLVYVVDRRAVVDQATAEAEKLRGALNGGASELKSALGLDARKSLPISTLRGQHVDNRDWLADPAAPAIIVGTVDMIGSRLLFEGYGVSRKMRPYHAGLLGADALIVLDEAHLVPPFEKLIAAIEKGQRADYESDRQSALGPRSANDRETIPPLRLLSLSATGREREGKVFRLKDEDRQDALVKQRLEATKAVSVKQLQEKEKLEDALASAAWELTDNGARPVRCLIYCDKRETAQKVCDALSDSAKPAKKGEAKKAEVELFTGARRFCEREKTAAKLKDPLGFIAGETNKTDKPVFLVATSAAEVGVDLDADHMVCDLVAWERMVQRFGRVNRRGGDAREAKIVLVDEGEPKPKKPDEPTEAEGRALLNFRSLAVIRQLGNAGDAGFDASPASLLELKTRAANEDALHEAIDAATTPAPLYPALNRALADAWSMTSLAAHTGRPEVAPWLRGWVDEDGPQTAIVWRKYLPVRMNGEATDKEVEEFFEAAPPHLSEKLETETYAVVDWLMARAEAISENNSPTPDAPAAAEMDADEPEDIETDGAASESNARPLKSADIVAFSLTSARELKKSYRLGDFVGDKKIKDALQRELAGKTLVIDGRFGGLSGGLLDAKSLGAVRSADDGGDWLWEEEPSSGKSGVPLVKFRVRLATSAGEKETPDADRNVWRFDDEFVIRSDDEEAKEWLVVEHLKEDAKKEDARSISRPQALDEHQNWAKGRAEFLAERLALPDDLKQVLTLSARLHDEGKRSKRWQRAFNAHKADQTLDRPLAKTKGPIDQALLDGYRHEFGSLAVFEENNIWANELPEEIREEIRRHSDRPELLDLVKHLVAAHHGGARPVIETRSCDDAPPSALEARARDVALRFARLQKRWGPWGLAWLEALLRAADAQASRDNDERDLAEGA